MVHFIVEHFCPGLEEGILRARLLAALALERLAQGSTEPLRRTGDDLFLGDKKLSVSVATASPVSVKIHFGVNVTPDGAPVEAAGLRDVNVDPEGFARALLADYALEIEGVVSARTKVRGVD
ncbi:MAG: DUF366 family protein, partial [Planctomycetota bacterium]|jgi:hypothetical protein